jgi:hypothetical protein
MDWCRPRELFSLEMAPTSIAVINKYMNGLGKDCHRFLVKMNAFINTPVGAGIHLDPQHPLPKPAVTLGTEPVPMMY